MDDVLFLQGVFLETLDDSGGATSVAVPQEIKSEITYDKLPMIFKGLDTWPVSTNLRCWNCYRSFDSRPVFIPGDLQRNGHMSVGGCYCTFACATRYINLHYDGGELWDVHHSLLQLYKIFTGVLVIDIAVAPDIYEMVQFGGHITQEDYYRELEGLQEAYTQALAHNMISSISHNF